LVIMSDSDGGEPTGEQVVIVVRIVC